MTTQLSIAQIQQAYVAFFNRPADHAGMQFWHNTFRGTQVELFAQFARSPEYTARFEGQSPVAQITLVYQQLLGREPDLGGLNFWLGHLQAGRVTVATLAHTIMQGALAQPATHPDRLTVENRVTAATNFTAALDTVAEIRGYDGAAAAAVAQTWLAGINHATPAANLAGAAVEAVVASTVTAGTAAINVGQTFTLTAGVNNFVGTAGNDTFNAFIDTSDAGGGRSTFTAQDTIDGGAGTDTLNIFTNGTINNLFPAFASVKNVEIVNIYADGGNFTTDGTDLSAAKFQGVQQLWQIGAAANVTNLGANTAAGFRNTDGLGATVTTATGNTTATIALDNVSGASSVDTVGANTINVVGALSDAAGTGFTLDFTTSAAATTTVTINTAVDTTLVSSAANTGLTTVNAAGSTGDITYIAAAAVVNVTTGTGDDTLTIAATAKATVNTGEGDDTVTATDVLAADTVINLGAGDDRLVLGAAPAAGVTLSGGEGTDTLAMQKATYGTISGDSWGADAAASTAARAKITGFEVLEITDGLVAGDSFDVSKIAGITSFVSSGGVTLANGESATVSGVTSGSSVTLSGVQSYGATGKLVVQVKDAATGTADVLNLNLGTESATVRVEAAGVETVNVNASGQTANTVSTITLALINNGLVTLNVAGNDILDFTAAAGMTKLATIDASANTAGVIIDTSAIAATQVVTITGTAKDDTIVLSARDVVNAGDGDDTITLANFAQVTGGAGEDTFVLSASANQVSYATILDFSTADDSILTLGTTFNSTKITLAANAVFSDYVEAASAGRANTVSWFQFGGNTYIVSDESDAANFVNGADAIVEIVGLVDFSTATLTSGVLSFA